MIHLRHVNLVSGSYTVYAIRHIAIYNIQSAMQPPTKSLMRINIQHTYAGHSHGFVDVVHWHDMTDSLRHEWT